jgi:hypothetical protein
MCIYQIKGVMELYVRNFDGINKWNSIKHKYKKHLSAMVLKPHGPVLTQY